MGFWRWVFGSSAPGIPGWAPFDNHEDFEAFVEDVALVLEDRGLVPDRVVIRSGSLFVDVEGKRVEWHLSLLAEKCARSKRTSWAKSIAAALPGKQQPGGQRTRKRARADKLGHIRLQLFSEEYLAAIHIRRDAIVSRPLTSRLHAVLVADLGGGEITLAPSDVAGFRWSNEDLFRLAQDQSTQAELGRAQITAAGEGKSAIEVAVSNGFYLGAGMLTILEQMEAPEGALVVFLSWHHVIVHVISEVTPKVLENLLELTERIREHMKVEFSELLDGELLWFRKDLGFQSVEVAGSGATSRIVGPRDLMRALCA